MELKADETGKAMVPMLACVLGQLCERNDSMMLNQGHVTKFHALHPPAISIRDYLERVAKYAACSGECFILALVYVDRIIAANSHFTVTSLNIHRLLITSIMLAAKYFDDQYFNNAYYSKVGGVPTNEINLLEVEFLFMTNFSLYVTTQEYRQYYIELTNHAINSNCSCSRSGIQVPPLIIPEIEYTPQLTDMLAQQAANMAISQFNASSSSTGFGNNEQVEMADDQTYGFNQYGNTQQYYPVQQQQQNQLQVQHQQQHQQQHMPQYQQYYGGQAGFGAPMNYYAPQQQPHGMPQQPVHGMMDEEFAGSPHNKTIVVDH